MSYYDATAKGYNELHGEEQLTKARIILAYLKEHHLIDEHMRILDVGAGTTKVTALFPGDKTALDPAKELLKQGIDPSIKRVHGVAEDLPFADQWFDIVLSLTAVHNFKDFKKGIAEMRRVASKLVIITLLKKSPQYKEIEKEIRKMKGVATLDDPIDAIFVCKP
ncbi:methyltransferase domain-containing protein [Candidatus Woesearchaeota archaeon]|nr:methyltransferase domain-containing protein [Candidatus Woesearchaeota archaeon]